MAGSPHALEQVSHQLATEVFCALDSAGIAKFSPHLKTRLIRKAARVYEKNFLPIFELYARGNASPDLMYLCALLNVYGLLLDKVIDGHADNPWDIPEYSQAAGFLLIELVEILHKAYGRQALDQFKALYAVQSQYLALEKEWEIPARFCNRYSQFDNVYEKMILGLFPVSLLPSDSGCTEKLQFLKCYFSLELAVDDVYDFTADVNAQTLNYPIALYYSQTGQMPEPQSTCLEAVLPTIRSDIRNAEQLLHSQAYEEVWAASPSAQRHIGLFLDGFEVLAQKLGATGELST
jgi:hypothetical protein